MAKVYKVEMYITDVNEEFHNTYHIRPYIEDWHRWVATKVANIQESVEFEWEDDLKINKVDASIEDFEEYFKDDNTSDMKYLKELLVEEFKLKQEEAEKLIFKYKKTTPLLLDNDMLEYDQIAEALINGDKEGFTDDQWATHINEIRD